MLSNASLTASDFANSSNGCPLRRPVAVGQGTAARCPLEYRDLWLHKLCQIETRDIAAEASAAERPSINRNDRQWRERPLSQTVPSSGSLLTTSSFLLCTGRRFQPSFIDQKILDFGTALESVSKPNGLRSTARPLVSLFIAILWWHLLAQSRPCPLSVTCDTTNMGHVLAEQGKLLP